MSDLVSLSSIIISAGTFLDFTHPSAAYLLHLLDLIIVLKEGKVVEQGTHEELMQEKGLYYSMWLQQASSEGAGNGGLE